jgi:hypothetical protein
VTSDFPPPLERRLNPGGLELVRAGKITAADFANGKWPQPCPGGTCPSNYTLPYVPEDAWAEPTSRPYKPSRYAVVPRSVPVPWLFVDADRVVEQFPPAAQALLRGKQRIYNLNISFPASTFGGPLPPFEAFEVTAAEASALRQILGDDFARFGLLSIYPHGQPVSWRVVR